MKTLRIFPLIAICFALTSVASGQKSTTETFNVSGNCGMCKAKIEKAAKAAGATYAAWDVDTKKLTVKFNSASTNTAKIQNKIAAVGYDNVGAKATDEAYSKLHGCCQYDRGTSKKESCCEGKETCDHGAMATTDITSTDCCKDGKCINKDGTSMDCCKDGKCINKDGTSMDCCKDGKCSHKDGAMDCCKDGKCSKPGHSVKDCCKKS